MFEQFTDSLSRIERFDTLVSTKDLAISTIELPSGATRLGLQLPAGEAMTLEPRAHAQLLGQWDVPADHFARLPRSLQVAEIEHFTRTHPREITIRAIREPQAPYAAARAVVSGRYSPFDHVDVLRTVAPYLDGWEIQRPDIHRDEMVLVATKPQVHDVSTRKVGDLVKLGLSIRNSEVGTMALGVEFVAWRVVCSNGMVCPQAEVSVRQRHIWLDRRSFEVQLRNAVANVAEIGEAVVRQLRAAHDLLLPNLDPDAGKLQADVVKVLRRDGAWTREFQRAVTEALGSQEEASVFGLVQFLTGDWAKSRPPADRLALERTAGRLMALAA